MEGKHYEPTPEEIEKGEDSMTENQEYMGKIRNNDMNGVSLEELKDINVISYKPRGIIQCVNGDGSMSYFRRSSYINFKCSNHTIEVEKVPDITEARKISSRIRNPNWNYFYRLSVDGIEIADEERAKAIYNKYIKIAKLVKKESEYTEDANFFDYEEDELEGLHGEEFEIAYEDKKRKEEDEKTAQSEEMLKRNLGLLKEVDKLIGNLN
jgi:hypothetical protein